MKLAKLALAGALGAFLFTSAQAAPAVAPKITSDSVVELTQAKKKAVKKKAAKKKVVKKKAAKKKVLKKKAGAKKKSAKAAKKVAKVGPGRCGAKKFWSVKQKKCVSKG